jgi:hypothetical protein
VHSYLVERQGLSQARQESLRSRRAEVSRLDREVNDRFTQLERQRAEWDRRVKMMLEGAVIEVKEQMQ